MFKTFNFTIQTLYIKFYKKPHRLVGDLLSLEKAKSRRV